jgi:hypothetical protein
MSYIFDHQRNANQKLRCHLTSVKMAIIKKTNKDVGEKKHYTLFVGRLISPGSMEISNGSSSKH